MFFHSRCAFLRVALVAYATTVSATPSLTVMTWAPNVNVVGLKNLKVTATITNTGRKTLKLLNEPRGVLSSFPDDSFVITNATGSSPSFEGARVGHVSRYMINLRTNAPALQSQAKYSPTYAAGLDNPSVFTVLSPGHSINVTHDRKRIDSIIVTVSLIIMSPNNPQSPLHTTLLNPAPETTPLDH